MLARSTSASNNRSAEDAQPLLDRSRDQHDYDHDDERRVVFAVDEGDEDEGYIPKYRDDAHDRVDGEREQGTFVRSGPPLRSTVQSREAQFDLDDDILEEGDYQHHASLRDSIRRSGSASPMPLIIGLAEHSQHRRAASLDGADVGIDLEELAQQRHKGGGMLDSIANMANSILGAGIIGLPYALSRAGFVTGIILLVTLCGVTDWTIRLIVTNAKLSGRSSYIEIMHSCFGQSGKAFVSVFQFAFAFGGMCAFGIIIGDTIPHVIRSVFPGLVSMPVLSILGNRQFVIALCTVCISYPLSLYRDIHKLARASGFALVGMLIIVGSVLFEGQRASPELRGDPAKRFTFIEPGIFEAIGVISFAFVCHHNSLLIYGSLKTPTLDRFALVTHVSTALSLVCCLLMAVSAYIVFTDKTQGNILNNFGKDDTLINVARFCFGLNMFTTLPLELFVCREVIEQYFFSHEAFNQQRHILFTTAILFASMFISMITCDLGVMLELTGGISATALAFIFPAACFIKLSDKSLSWRSRTKLPAYLCCGFGITVLALSVLLALGKYFTPPASAGETKICM